MDRYRRTELSVASGWFWVLVEHAEQIRQCQKGEKIRKILVASSASVQGGASVNKVMLARAFLHCGADAASAFLSFSFSCGHAGIVVVLP
jgi:hypothetical protein